ncbi:MAG: ShlB/FhaC/HecB family hemolysin secretion/activation protein [Sideroxydans sp.]|jgi:hemolysin activation/secretion protein/uncharacterized protein YchJ
MAQAPLPDAGALQEQIERGQQLRLPQRVAPDKPAVPPQMQTGGVSITVKQFRFAGNALLSNERLATVVASYLDRPLNFVELQTVTTTIANAYREAGWVVRAYLPQQDIQGGVVTIQIVEAVFGKLIPEGTPAHLKLSVVRSRFEAQQPSGQPLNAEALDRALLLIDDLPGIAVAGALQAGEREGETDFALKMTDEPRVTGEVSADNAGSRSTGAERLSTNLALASPLGLGDQLSANIIHTGGSDYLRLGYSLPVGADGWRVSGNTSKLVYHLTAPEFDTLKARGDSNMSGVEASYPVIRSRMKNLYLNLAYDSKAFDNRTVTGISSNYDIDLLTAGLTGNLFDRWGGGGANAFSLALSQGRMALGQIDSSEDAALAGGYRKLRYTLSRQQVITEDLSAFAAFSGQWAGKNLDSSEKFYLGGANGVRAYPTSEGAGNKGQMLNLEMRHKLPQGFAATAFYDWGRITQNIDNSIAAVTPNSYSLHGFGLSLAWEATFGLHAKATWARRDGDNPNPTAIGNDQDGSLKRDRWWFELAMPFDLGTCCKTGERNPIVATGSTAESTTEPTTETTAKSTALSTAEPLAEVTASVTQAPQPVTTKAATSTEAEQVDVTDEVRAALWAWKQAWAARDVDTYLDKYTPGYHSPALSQMKWKARRKNRLSTPEWITLDITEPRIQVKDDRATLRFTQRYESNLYRDTVHKKLRLQRIDGKWRIVAERASAPLLQKNK